MSNVKRMPLDELEKTHEFQRLTPKQKMFVQTYVGGGSIDGNYDAVAAINTAYTCKSNEVARIMSYSLLANINVVAVLNRHFGNEPIDSFLATLDRAVRNKHLTIAQLGALRLQCEVMGFSTKLPRPDHNWSDAVEASIANRPKKPRKTTSASPPPAGPPTYEF